jgi:hypothetical protein
MRRMGTGILYPRTGECYHGVSLRPGLMTSRVDFTDEEWERLGRGPLVAGLAISLADPGGPFEALKESRAVLTMLLDTAREGGYGDFVQSLAGDVAAKAQRRENPLAGFTPDRRHALDAILGELRSVYGLLVEKAAPEDVDDYREWMRTASQRAALAAKEGGFLGIGGRLVSAKEQEMLETLGEIFGVPRG